MKTKIVTKIGNQTPHQNGINFVKNTYLIKKKNNIKEMILDKPKITLNHSYEINEKELKIRRIKDFIGATKLYSGRLIILINSLRHLLKIQK